MSALQPMAVYALRVDPTEDLVAALPSIGANLPMFRITMAAIDPSEDPDSVELDPSTMTQHEGLGFDASEMALCTLDTRSQYQQPLDLTIGQGEQVFFRVVGSHPVYLTGNYSDFLDDLDDPRVTELDGADDEAPQLTKIGASAKSKQGAQAASKGKNKRPAADESDDDEVEPGLDDIVAKSLKKDEAAAAAAANDNTGDAAATGETKKLSKAEKRKLKKLKKNDGTAAEASSSAPEPAKAKDAPAGNGIAATEKKVQFDKDLVKGPTPNGDGKTASTPANKSISVRDVNGVTIDDRKIGNGPAAKKGSKLEMRYIGKLESTLAVFDSNKSGKPFSFKLGAGEVIKGWDIGLEGIKPGGERRIIVPAHLAYGKKSMPGIPANSKLIFDVKCLAVK
ncbi:hypothetical protein DV736_g1471, partial [Chaetothyriales sp. CBS 134916]